MQEGSGTRAYQLLILVEKDIVVAIGKIGSFKFPAGEYIYTGSAKKNIKSRIARHFSKEKTLKWHIDYPLSAPEVKIVGVAFSEKPECTVNHKTSGEIIVPLFGSTDCRNGCGSHLKFRGRSLNLEKALEE